MADYSKMMADYQSAQTASNAADQNQNYRAQQNYNQEIERQRRELKKKNGFWNKLGHAVTGGLTSGLEQGVSGLVSTAFNPSQMLGGAKGTASAAGGGGGAENGYAQYMAQGAPDASGGAGLMGGQTFQMDPALKAAFIP